MINKNGILIQSCLTLSCKLCWEQRIKLTYEWDDLSVIILCHWLHWVSSYCVTDYIECHHIVSLTTLSVIILCHWLHWVSSYCVTDYIECHHIVSLTTLSVIILCHWLHWVSSYCVTDYIECHHIVSLTTVYLTLLNFHGFVPVVMLHSC